MAGGVALLRQGDRGEGSVGKRPSQRQDWERDRPEPVTLLDKDAPGHLALCGWQSSTPAKWAGLLVMKTVSGEDYIVPSDYALGEISRLYYCIWREEPAFP